MTQRINKTTSELIAIPPTTWHVKSVQWLLDQDEMEKNWERIPLNEPLLKSLERDGMINPILVMPNWYPIAGSQRLRACKSSNSDTLLSQKIRVARFDREWWNAFYLWPDLEFRDKAIQVFFQCIETAWKTEFYIANKDRAGKSMIEFEQEGDKLKGWRAKEDLEAAAKFLGG